MNQQPDQLYKKNQKILWKYIQKTEISQIECIQLSTLIEKIQEKTKKLIELQSLEINKKQCNQIVKIFIKLTLNLKIINGCNLKSIRRSQEQLQTFFENLQEHFSHNQEFTNKFKEIEKLDDKSQQIIRMFNLLKSNECLNQEITYYHRFFEISLANFFKLRQKIYKQTYVLKKKFQKKKLSLPKIVVQRIQQMFTSYAERWVIITQNGIGYVSDNDLCQKNLREYSFFKKPLILKELDRDIICIEFALRKYNLKFNNNLELFDFYYALIDSYSSSQIVQNNRFQSFCPIYEKQQAKIFINGNKGKTYFEELYDQFSNAKYEIYIQGWFFFPKLYLKRPVEDYPDSQIENVLLKAAKRGVKIYIIMWNEIEASEFHDSANTESNFNKMHTNINVIRVPEFVVHFWSIHTKMVIIDSKVAFCGGMDLALGRWEKEGFPIQEPEQDKTYFLGKDYQNPIYEENENIQEWDKCQFDKTKNLRMPWRDVQVMIIGQVAEKFALSFKEMWNFNQQQANEKQPLVQYSHYQQDKNQTIKKQSKDKKLLKSEKFALEQKLFNRIHDLLQDKPNLDKKKLQKLKKDIYTQYNIQQNSNNIYTKKKIFQEEEDIDLELDQYEDDDNDQQTISVQIVRSESNWSIGLPENNLDDSIYKAYCETIKSAEKFIYIENQYFVSSIGDDLIQNQVVSVLADRILKAIDKDEDFLVILVIPLHPDQTGQITDETGDMVRIQYELNLDTLYRSENSLIKKLKKKTDNWQKYLKVYGLRNHTIQNGEPKTEIIYVHSKVMFVDDKKAIIGSANINDRSMLPERDSEIGVVIEDEKIIECKFNGKKFNKGQTIKQFRIDLMKSLIVKDDLNYDDPMSKQFLETWDNIAKENDSFYFKSFKNIPHNEFKTFEQIQKAEQNKRTDREYYNNNKDKVQGYLLAFPFQFLSEEGKLSDNFNDYKRAILPSYIFV